MTEQWRELKETILEMRDNGGTGTQQEVCAFLANLMDVLENSSEKPNKSDTIYRQAAIRIASGYCHPANIAAELSKLPSAQPEPKTAHWIEGRTNNPKIHNILCSNCFEGTQSKGHARSQYTREKFKYCRNCGARMIESQESEE